MNFMLHIFALRAHSAKMGYKIFYLGPLPNVHCIQCLYSSSRDKPGGTTE